MLFRSIEWAGVVAAAALGFTLIQISGSRGPLVALVVCIITVALLDKRYRYLLLPLIAGGLLLFGGSTEDSQSVLASRVTESTQNDNPEVRILMIAGAFGQFIDSPLIGSSIIEQQFEDYPHNPFIEAAMALGIGGLLFLGTINVKAIKRIVRELRHGSLLVPLLAVQALVGAQVSGAISASASMWMFLALYAGAVEKTSGRKRMAHTNATQRSQLEIE